MGVYSRPFPRLKLAEFTYELLPHLVVVAGENLPGLLFGDLGARVLAASAWKNGLSSSAC